MSNAIERHEKHLHTRAVKENHSHILNECQVQPQQWNFKTSDLTGALNLDPLFYSGRGHTPVRQEQNTVEQMPVQKCGHAQTPKYWGGHGHGGASNGNATGHNGNGNGGKG